jgi:outer membrane lipoprotein-sorting protein
MNIRNTICRRLLCLILPLILGLALRANAEDPVATGQLLVDQLQHRLALASGINAEFEQVNYWVVMDEADSARGELTLAPPHRFRLEYSDPAGHLVGCDGTYIWTYMPEEKQVLRSALFHTTGWGDFFLDGLAGKIDSSAVFVGGPAGQRRVRIDLGPHPQWNLKRLFIEIDIGSGDPAAYSYLDDEGNQTRFEFLSFHYPPVAFDRDFQFTVPEGYERLDVD